MQTTRDTSSTTTTTTTTNNDPKKTKDENNPNIADVDSDEENVTDGETDAADVEEDAPKDSRNPVQRRQDNERRINNDLEIMMGKARNSQGRRKTIWDALVKPYLVKHLDHIKKPEKDVNADAMETGLLEAADLTSDAAVTTAAALNVDNARHAYDSQNDIKEPEKADSHMHVNDVFANSGLLLTGITNGIAGIYNAGKSAKSIHEAKKSGNRNKRNQGRYGVTSGLLGLLSGGFQSASAGVGLSGDAKTGGYLALVAYSFDIFNNITNTRAARSNANHHNRVAKKIGGRNGYLRRHSNDADNTGLDVKESDNIERTRRLKRISKVQKYSMQQAQRYNSRMAKQEYSRARREGICGIGSSLLGLGAGLATTVGGDYRGGMLGSGIMGLAQMALKTVGRGIRYGKAISKENQKTRDSKTVVEEYVDAKKPGIEKEISEQFKNGDWASVDFSDLSPLSDDLAEKITLARLGLDVELEEGKKVPDETYKKAFNIITLKRAGYIYNSGSAKMEMLLSLGLDPGKATLQDIAEALGYEE